MPACTCAHIQCTYGGVVPGRVCARVSVSVRVHGSQTKTQGNAPLSSAPPLSEIGCARVRTHETHFAASQLPSFILPWME